MLHKEAYDILMKKHKSDQYILKKRFRIIKKKSKNFVNNVNH